jgi:hypothetical protein
METKEKNGDAIGLLKIKYSFDLKLHFLNKIKRNTKSEEEKEKGKQKIKERDKRKGKRRKMRKKEM